MRLILFLCISLLMTTFTNAQDSWDVTNPDLGETSSLSFTTDEGTWINLDVSPDGEHIVFDLLGDIYIMPISGGKANLLRGGHAYEVQPRFSPDGSQISFTSDAGGGDNIWTMNVDGSNATQITDENFRLLNNSTWMPDENTSSPKNTFHPAARLVQGKSGCSTKLVEQEFNS